MIPPIRKQFGTCYEILLNRKGGLCCKCIADAGLANFIIIPSGVGRARPEILHTYSDSTTNISDIIKLDAKLPKWISGLRYISMHLALMDTRPWQRYSISILVELWPRHVYLCARLTFKIWGETLPPGLEKEFRTSDFQNKRRFMLLNFLFRRNFQIDFFLSLFLGDILLK